MSLIPLPQTLIPFLQPYEPQDRPSRPFVTLSYAQSLDSRIASRPGEQTKISHLETKTMTHYIRLKHDAILVGAGTVLADDPKLNCRYSDGFVDPGSHIRPVVLDPHAKWKYSKSTLHQISARGEGLAPFIIIDRSIKPRKEDLDALKEQNGRFLSLDLTESNRVDNWGTIFKALATEGLMSVMVEGGATIINDLLLFHSRQPVLDSLIITIGPVFLGKDGVEVSPLAHVDLEEVKWWTGTRDSVVAARVKGKH